MLVTIDMHCHRHTQSQQQQTAASSGDQTRPGQEIAAELGNFGAEKFKFIF